MSDIHLGYGSVMLYKFSDLISVMTLQGRPQFISEAISRLPTKTPEEVHEHETWYRELLNHQELKRLAIKAWKNKKQVRFIWGINQ